jgi:hypothetical protein
MSSDLTKLLFVCPPFKGVKITNSRFIKLRVLIMGEETSVRWYIYYSRDVLGLGWITVKRGDGIPEPGSKISIGGINFNNDQMFRTWLPINLCIKTRRARVEILKQIGIQAVKYCIDNPDVKNVCIPRMMVFKQPDSTLSYAFELIDGDDPKTVACSIGNENILLASEFATKGILYSPIRIGEDDEPDELFDKPRGKFKSDFSSGESDYDVKSDDGKDEELSDTGNDDEFSTLRNQRILRSSYESIDPLAEASKIPDGEPRFPRNPSFSGALGGGTPEVKDIPFSLTKAPRQSKGKAVVVEKLSTKVVRRRKKTSSEAEPT